MRLSEYGDEDNMLAAEAEASESWGWAGEVALLEALARRQARQEQEQEHEQVRARVRHTWFTQQLLEYGEDEAAGADDPVVTGERGWRCEEGQENGSGDERSTLVIDGGGRACGDRDTLPRTWDLRDMVVRTPFSLSPSHQTGSWGGHLPEDAARGEGGEGGHAKRRRRRSRAGAQKECTSSEGEGKGEREREGRVGEGEGVAAGAQEAHTGKLARCERRGRAATRERRGTAEVEARGAEPDERKACQEAEPARTLSCPVLSQRPQAKHDAGAGAGREVGVGEDEARMQVLRNQRGLIVYSFS